MLPQDIHIEGQNLEILPEWREKIEAELARLQQHYHNPILHARVEIIGTAHHRLGAFEVHLVVNIPGDTITLIRQGEMVVPLLVEAFDALDRRLRQHSEEVQQKVKTHVEVAQHGKVARLFPADDYGFIETEDGLEVYFHAHAVKGGKFGHLTSGAAVTFAQEPGDKGPQAIWVQPQ
ncbi:MAG: cold shock domain-containing protein [Syntrophobacterales bacterium]|jgi:cold shock CspA family protein|nr:cold shock domain-containing protein [Syntrophobacterales bacterium]